MSKIECSTGSRPNHSPHAPGEECDRPEERGAQPVPMRVPVALQWIWLAPRNAAIAFMNGYRRVVSPLYGQVCRYYPSCSRYAVEAFQRQGFLAGVLLTTWRLLRCNPFTRGGVDDPPLRRNQRFILTDRGYVRPINRKAFALGVH